MSFLWSGPRGFNCLISFAPVFSCMYYRVLIFVYLLFYLLIYMYEEIMHLQVREFSCIPNIYVTLSTSERKVGLKKFTPSSI